MDNLLIKLKDELKRLRKERERYVKESDLELFDLSILIEEIEQVYNKPWYENLFSSRKPVSVSDAVIMRELKLVEDFNFTGCSITDLVIKSKNGDKKVFTMFYGIKNNFENHVRGKVEASAKRLQSYINAFENDKVKAPIIDVEDFFCELARTSLSNEEISRIIGMVIVFNKEYFDKHKGTINYADKRILNTLYDYYNKDGTFKYNKNADIYLSNIRLLLAGGLGVDEKRTPGITPCRFISDACFRILLDLSNTEYEKVGTQVDIVPVIMPLVSCGTGTKRRVLEKNLKSNN